MAWKLTQVVCSTSKQFSFGIPKQFHPKVCKKKITTQRAKKVVSDSLGLVDFAIRLVIFVSNLPNGQVLFFGEIQITEGL